MLKSINNFREDRVLQRRMLLAALSGGLLFFSFPQFGNGLVAWFALLPLFYALKGSTPAEGFRTGFITGMVANIGILYWISYVVVQYGGLPLYVGVAVMLLLAAYLSIYTGLFAAGAVFFRKGGNDSLLVVPLLWVILEFARSRFFTGFPWENLGYSQYLNSIIIQIADITGVYGVSFAIVLVNKAIFEILEARRATGRIPIGKLLIAFAVVLLIVFYGFFRLADIKDSLTEAPSAEVALVQGNIDQNSKWDPRYQAETIDIYAGLSLGALPARGGLIVWPETAAPFFFGYPSPLQKKVIALARTAERALLFGSPHYEQEGATAAYMNSAYLLEPGGAVAGRYDKVHLVPYGEYVPLKQLFPFIGKLVTGIGDFRAGSDFAPLVSGKRRFGVFICYEGIFPEAARAYKKRGAELLVNITNDAWFGKTSAPYQHLSMTVFRAVETRLFLVRAANTGISAIIAPTGQISSRTAIFTRTVLRGEVKYVDKKTFYAAYGDTFAYICFIMLIVYEVITRRRMKHAGRNT
ncbi:MAG: apolipoprotein N-acyltransferase [Syntrophobacterales bacterium]|nr:apolipoprotein N-acyltransferase [Syntrophobacterales bacterium]